MRGLLKDALLPIMAERAGKDPNVILSHTVRTTGIGESALAEQLGDLARGVDDLPLAFLPSWTGVDLRLTSTARRAPSAASALAAAAAKLRAPVERYVYGENETDLAAVVLELCRAKQLKLATAESCTGGLVGARVTAIPGSSDVFVGGIISYANAVKEKELHVSADLLREHGAVSEPVARAMAEGACAELGADIGIAITGIAGPDGGTEDKPVGTTWIAVRAAGETRATTRKFLGDREEIRLRASQGALDMVRRALTPQIT
jgi:nicotinamide-nucleotide amidase